MTAGPAEAPQRGAVSLLFEALFWMTIHFDLEENITLAAVGNRLRVGPAARVPRRAKPDTLASGATPLGPPRLLQEGPLCTWALKPLRKGSSTPALTNQREIISSDFKIHWEGGTSLVG